MSAPQPPGILERLAPEVVAFKRRAFALRYDLEQLDKVRRVKAHEATALYCGRILEALAPAALEMLHLKMTRKVASDLEVLAQHNFLRPPVTYWAHALRRLGNEARHLQRRLWHRDAETALLFLERWLRWFFCQFAGQPRPLPHLTRDGQPLGWAGRKDLQPVVEALEAADLQTQAVLELARAQGHQAAFLRTPTLAAVLAEVLLDRNEPAAALEVLTAALQETPHDLRLRQLLGLYYSRTGDLEQALRCLEKLGRDEETVGIQAGIFKRLWQKDPGNRRHLNACHKAYQSGWEASQRSNTYLGINAAATALWNGNPDTARAVAADIEKVLRERRTALAKRGEVLGYWDQVTLAEAQLLQGSLDEAVETYRAAFLRFADLQGAIAVTRQQAMRILEALGRGVEAACLP